MFSARWDPQTFHRDVVAAITVHGKKGKKQEIFITHKDI